MSAQEKEYKLIHPLESRYLIVKGLYSMFEVLQAIHEKHPIDLRSADDVSEHEEETGEEDEEQDGKHRINPKLYREQLEFEDGKKRTFTYVMVNIDGEKRRIYTFLAKSKKQSPAGDIYALTSLKKVPVITYIHPYARDTIPRITSLSHFFPIMFQTPDDIALYMKSGVLFQDQFELQYFINSKIKYVMERIKTLGAFKEHAQEKQAKWGDRNGGHARDDRQERDERQPRQQRPARKNGKKNQRQVQPAQPSSPQGQWALPRPDPTPQMMPQPMPMQGFAMPQQNPQQMMQQMQQMMQMMQMMNSMQNGGGN